MQHLYECVMSVPMNRKRNEMDRSLPPSFPSSWASAWVGPELWFHASFALDLLDHPDPAWSAGVSQMGVVPA